MQIRPLDASDPAAMADWHATFHAAHVFGQDYPSPWMLEEMRAEFLGSRAGERIEPFGGYVDGGLRRAPGFVELPQMDNLHIARVEVATHPEHRGRGLRLRDARPPHRRGVAQGRNTLNADAVWAYDGPADGAGTPNADFLTRRGFAFSLGDVKRVLDAARGRRAAGAAGRRGRRRTTRATRCGTSRARCPRTSSTRSGTWSGR